MPELPEVETIARSLRAGKDGQPGIIGLAIEGADLLWERTLAQPSPAEFTSRIAGQRVESVGRRGKFLILSLSRDKLLFHLRMSGDLYVEDRRQPVTPHHRLLINFVGSKRLVFNDVRKFGRAWLTAFPAEVLIRLGPEPWDETLTPQAFYLGLQKRTRQLKPLLMDQSFLAGLGNIYTDEALNLARLHPLQPANTVTPEQASSLLNSIRSVLEAGISRHGTSIDWVYRGGDYQKYLRVYQRTGDPCPECGSPIKKITVGQRGTHYCPKCQKLPIDI